MTRFGRSSAPALGSSGSGITRNAEVKNLYFFKWRQQQYPP